MKGSSGFFIIIVVIVLVYVLLFLPQRRQQKARQTMMSQLAPGNRILTAGGIYAMVTEVTSEKIVARIGLDEGLLVELDHRAVLRVVNDVPASDTPVSEPEESEDYEEEGEGAKEENP